MERNVLVKPIFKAFVLLFILLFTACSSDSSVEEEVYIEDKITTNYSAIEKEIVQLIEAYRQSKKLSALSLNDAVSKTASNHNYYMIGEGELSHDNFNERSKEITEQTGAIAVSENVGYGYDTASEIVNAWIASESHRKNIEGDFDSMGISAIKDEAGEYYFANIFIKF